MLRPHRRRRARALPLLPIGLVPLLLFGCGWLFGQPILTVTPRVLELDSQTIRNGSILTITNTGSSDSQLSFSVTASDPRVHPVPASGSLPAGARQDIDLDIDDVTLTIGDLLDATLTIDSNGGSETVALTYVKTVGGLSACGTFPVAGSLRAGGAPSPPPTGRPDPPRANHFVPGQILVGYARPVGMQRSAEAAVDRRRLAEAVRQAYGLQQIAAGDNGPDLLYADDPDGVIARLRTDPRVRYAERNAYVELQFVPNDTYYASDQWNLSDFGLEQAWDLETGESNDVVIAIIDSGVQMHHRDLASKMLPGCDFNGNDNDPNPGPIVTSDTAHGTHVAGIAAATGDNTLGVTGVAFGSRVRLLPVKIFDDTGTRATVAQLARAIRWSVGLPLDGVADNQNPADIVNMSLGVPGHFQTLDDAAAAAWAAGALLVAAAGNHTGGQNASVMSPANGPHVMAVGSVDADRSLSYFSNVGPELDVVAPGGIGPAVCGYVLSTTPFDDYGCEAGTSMAAPFVAGEAALLKSQTPSLSNQALRDRILASTLSGGGTTEEIGNGIACVDLALGAATRCGAPLGP